MPSAAPSIRWWVAAVIVAAGAAAYALVALRPGIHTMHDSLRMHGSVHGAAEMPPMDFPPGPKEAIVAPNAKPDHRYEVDVPDLTPASFLSSKEQTIRQGDVIEFHVTSRRSGGVVVHGLTGMQPIAANGQTTVKFRAIYSGRFALHFHGNDGSHFELMALNVMPKAH